MDATKISYLVKLIAKSTNTCLYINWRAFRMRNNFIFFFFNQYIRYRWWVIFYHLQLLCFILLQTITNLLYVHFQVCKLSIVTRRRQLSYLCGWYYNWVTYLVILQHSIYLLFRNGISTAKTDYKGQFNAGLVSFVRWHTPDSSVACF